MIDWVSIARASPYNIIIFIIICICVERILPTVYTYIYVRVSLSPEESRSLAPVDNVNGRFYFLIKTLWYFMLYAV